MYIYAGRKKAEELKTSRLNAVFAALKLNHDMLPHASRSSGVLFVNVLYICFTESVVVSVCIYVCSHTQTLESMYV